MGNKADAISIGIALLIVSFVAAVQEYRSEQGAKLVPHTYRAGGMDKSMIISLGNSSWVICSLGSEQVPLSLYGATPHKCKYLLYAFSKSVAVLTCTSSLTT
jgi:hypothetical protein